MTLERPLNLCFDNDTDDVRLESDVDVDAITHKARALEKEISQLKKKVAALNSENIKLRKDAKKHGQETYRGDADIDDFLRDISPFFYNKSLTYVDIGAFTGEVFQKLYSSNYLKIREAHLYEPNPLSYEKLKERLSGIEGLHSLHAYNFAIGADDSIAHFVAANAMTKMVRNQELASETADSFTCEVKPFDSQVDNFTERHVHLLKIDVEGVELSVLSGAHKALEEGSVDVIYIEVGFNIDGKQQAYFASIDNYLQECGYRVFKIYEQRHEWIEDSPLLRRCNFAYMSSRFANSNPYKLTQELAVLRERVKQSEQGLDPSS